MKKALSIILLVLSVSLLVSCTKHSVPGPEEAKLELSDLQVTYNDDNSITISVAHDFPGPLMSAKFKISRYSSMTNSSYVDLDNPDAERWSVRIATSWFSNYTVYFINYTGTTGIGEVTSDGTGAVESNTLSFRTSF